MFGAMVWIFQDGHLSGLLGFTPTGALVDTMPILMFCVAFGLSMDYEVFLVSRMKELHDAGAANDDAVAGGLQSTGRIITAAALLDEHRLLRPRHQRHRLHEALRRRPHPGRADGRLRHPRHAGPGRHEAGRRGHLVGAPLASPRRHPADPTPTATRSTPNTCPGCSSHCSDSDATEGWIESSIQPSRCPPATWPPRGGSTSFCKHRRCPAGQLASWRCSGHRHRCWR